ncbi:MAG: sugar phosphate isomerase/epimerase [Oricola sp.]
MAAEGRSGLADTGHDIDDRYAARFLPSQVIRPKGRLTMTHPLSLAFLTIGDVGPVEAVCIASEAGYQMVGLRILPAALSGEGPYPLLTNDRLLAEVRAAVADTGVAIADVEIIRLNEKSRTEDFLPFLERCERLDARHVLVAGDDPQEDRLTANFAGFCDLAREHGLTADLEFMPWTKVPNLACARRIVENAGRSNGGVLVDALHFGRSNTTLDDIRVLPKTMINYAQVCDGAVPYDASDAGLIATARGARLMPGEGGIDLEGMIQALPDGVTLSVEIPNLELAKTKGPLERARMARDATVRLLERVGRLASD